MTIYVNGSIVGMHDAVKNKEYQQKLDAQVGDILENNEEISLTDLKKNSLFAKAYNNLDSDGKARLEQIANMGGAKEMVSEKELKVMLTALDANLQDFEYGGKIVQKFFMDGKPSTGKTGGLNQATDAELQYVYDNTKTRAEEIDEEKKKQEVWNNAVKKTSEQAKNIKPYDENGRVNGGEWAKAINIIHDNISWGSKRGLDAWNVAFRNILGKGQVINTDTYRDGGSKEWTLQNGTVVFYNNNPGSEECDYVTVTHPDGSKEKFKPDGSKVE